MNIFNNSFSTERDYECQILLCQILFAFRHKNNSLLLKGVLNVYIKIPLHGCYVHAHHCAHNLSNPDPASLMLNSSVRIHLLSFKQGN